MSDGPAGAVNVFSRNSLKVEATIPIYCSPRSIAFEPRSKLVFAICGPQYYRHRLRPLARSKQEPVNISGTSHVVAIDSQTRSVVADIVISGNLRFAAPDGTGQVYIGAGPAQFAVARNGKIVEDSVPQRIARLDAPSIAIAARQQMDQPPQRESQRPRSASNFDGLDKPRNSHFSRPLSAADQ